MEKIIDKFIPGFSTKKVRRRGNLSAPKKWREDIIKATKNEKKVTKPCLLEVTFYFREDQYPKDFPYGPDLDNHLKSLLDGLSETVLSKIPGKDSAIVKMIASKERAKGKRTGVRIIINQ